MKTTQQLDSFLNKNTENLKNLDKTKIVLWLENSNDTLRSTIFYMLEKKDKIHTFAYYSDLYEFFLLPLILEISTRSDTYVVALKKIKTTNESN